MLDYDKIKEFFELYNSEEGCYLDKFISKARKKKISEGEAFALWTSFDVATTHWYDLVREKYGIVFK